LEEIPVEDEVLVVCGATLVLLLYGPPLVEVVEGKPVDATAVVLPMLVGTLIVPLMDPLELVEDGEVPVVRGTVGPSVSEVLVPLPYGGPLVPLLEEDPVETAVVVPFAVLELEMVVELVVDVELVVLLVLETTEDETPVERGTVGPREVVLLVPLP
jgi:hypothetical protein